MRQSKLFVKSLREDPKNEESLNAKLLMRAGFIHKVMAGVYAFLPLGLRVIKKIENIIREEMVSLGADEILMSSLQTREAWETSGRYADLDVLFKFTSYYSKGDYVLGPTHEEEITPILKQHVFSYRDLPIYVFQIQNKFRDEKRAKSGLLRGREFLMKDLYSFHTDEKDMEDFYELSSATYSRIFERVGIGEKTYKTFASGGTFSKYSHEFQTVTPAGEDTIYICEACKLAINEEVIEDVNHTCPQCGSKELRMEKSIEVGNIFKMKDKYSAPFDLKFKDQSGDEKIVLMGCYGIGLSRLMGAIVESSNDENGIIWPEAVSPFRFHLLETKPGLGQDIYQRMVADGYEVLYDDRDVSFGEKLKDADLFGITWRLVVGEKNKDKIEIKRRNEEQIKLVEYGDIRKAE
ncbi:MAG: His/Gly/Thr/Pro-type tRNA ligase C-terminal domain-containing protein [Candidatus Colwellbacteria bacterium]|nr:His/Gly/Thr/Pro-type tRNA ligase C-terminal domain-containing protein [Candidatus Colwellbacteria bacterium]